MQAQNIATVDIAIIRPMEFTSFRPLLSVNIFGATGDFWDNSKIVWNELGLERSLHCASKRNNRRL